jgi:hypothetical protein
MTADNTGNMFDAFVNHCQYLVVALVSFHEKNYSYSIYKNKRIWKKVSE